MENKSSRKSEPKPVLPPSWEEAAREAAKVVLRGGVILYPTDTIWGIGCDATNKTAVERVFTIKGRPNGKAMLLLLDNEAKLPYYVGQVPSMAYELLDVAVSPLTIIYPEGRNIAPLLLAEDGSIGIRITKEAFSRRLCELCKVPIVSTSANFSGEISPKVFAEINPDLIALADYVVPIKRDETASHRASEIIKLGKGNEVEVIRPA